MTRLFGTDGVRGVANRDLTPDLALAVGRAGGLVLAPDGGRVVVGRDTRISGPMLEGALIAGLCSAGVHVVAAGVIPSPAVAFLTVDDGAAAGAVISASHNPVPDNGLKFFSDEGLKITQQVEELIEALVEEPRGGLPEGTKVGSVELLDSSHDRYLAHLVGSSPERLDGLKVVLDCAYGAAWNLAPRAFRETGAAVIELHAEPDGTRINVDCGSTSLDEVAKRVVEEGADLGLGFDGDADRVLAVDERGEVVDGDRIIGMAALRMKEAGELRNDVVVSTVMANLGFRRALEERGIEVLAAPVGDKYVAEAMAEHGSVLGGEQSGHVIFARHSTTGDGILTGLQVASIVASSGSRLSELADFFEPFPQVLINVAVKDRGALDGTRELWDRIRDAEASLGSDGRVLVRASGTERIVRVMVEAADGEVARRTAEELADAVRSQLA
jgi:phosphoglucosamine mutase